MTARCKICNRRNNFNATRGSKLSDQRCECGGKYEIVSGVDIGVWKNRAGDHFKIKLGQLYFQPLLNPIK